MTTLLIDADGIVFSAAAAAQKEIWWDDDIVTTHGELEEAKKIFDDQLGKIIEAAPGDPDIILAFSCPTRKYFRHDVYPAYKSHRGGATKPPLMRRRLGDWAISAYPSFMRPKLEADDVLGILATSEKPVKGEKIIVSIDKDLRQIPGVHLNPSKLHLGTYVVTPEEAVAQLWTQVLTGDATDGYPGCPGVGEVGARKILEKAGDDPLPNVRAAYLKAGLTDADLVQMVNVARILTRDTYNFKRKEPILWQISQQP